MIMSSSLQKAARILVLNGVAGILPVTPFLLGGKHLPTFTTLSASLPLIIFVPSVYLVPYILMIVIQAKCSCLLRPLARSPSRRTWTNLKLVPIRLFFWSVLLLLIWVIFLVSRNQSSAQGRLFPSLAFCLLSRKSRNSFPFCVLFLTPMLLI